MNINLKSLIEGIIFVVGEEGVGIRDIASIIDVPTQQVEEAIYEMQAEMNEQNRGIQISQLADKFVMVSKPEHNDYLSKLVQVPVRAPLSRPALETLAIVAYKQPITRLEIEEIRGVKSERTLHILQRKGLIKDVGRSKELGRPILYSTTNTFLDYFGLNCITELPAVESVFNSQATEDEKQNLFQQLGINKSGV